MKYRALPAIGWLLCGLFSGCEFGVEGAPVASEAAEPTSTRLSFTAPVVEPLAPPPRAAGRPRVARGYLRFVEGYRQGFEQATSEAKPMLVFFTAEWCHFCHQMADEAFTHPQVVSLSEHFVCVLVDADLEPEVVRQFQVQGFPTIQLLSSRGAPLERIVGKKPGHQLMMSMQAALQTVARRADDSADLAPR